MPRDTLPLAKHLDADGVAVLQRQRTAHLLAQVIPSGEGGKGEGGGGVPVNAMPRTFPFLQPLVNLVP